MTGWQAHCERWRGGCGSDLCARAKTVVLAKGTLPCDVLFIGEAPGDSEDVVGRPFVGPAGTCFQKYVVDPGLPRGVTCAFGNLLGCVPTDGTGRKVTFKDLPDPDATVELCSGRLVELITLARPKLVVCVGEQADTYLGPKSVGMRHGIRLPPDLAAVPRVHVIHPAAVLRMPVAGQGLAWQRCEVILRNAAEDALGLYTEDAPGAGTTGEARF